MKQLVLKVFKTLKKQIWALSLQDFLIITVRDNKNQFAELFFFWISTIETDLNIELRIAFSTSKSEINELLETQKWIGKYRRFQQKDQ